MHLTADSGACRVFCGCTFEICRVTWSVRCQVLGFKTSDLCHA